jgi:hypothetical protein
MRARTLFIRLLAGCALGAPLAGGCFDSLQAGPVGFAAGGNTTAGTYPVGNATGVTVASAKNGTSTLGIGTPINTSIIDNYMAAGTCTWLKPALAAEGYSFGTGAKQWTLNYMTLPAAAISLTTYLAWVNTKPAATGGDTTLAAAAAGAQQGNGGLAVGLTYNPSAAAITAGDPNPKGAAYLNWISVLATTNPYGFGTTYGVNVGNGFTAEIDNDYLGGGKLPDNPFYGGVNNGTGAFAGDSTGMVDRPSQPLPTALNKPYTFEAQSFLASWVPNVNPGGSNTTAGVIAGGGTITVYDGVWWGFQLSVPEPSTYALMISGGIYGLVAWSYRTARKRSKGSD